MSREQAFPIKKSTIVNLDIDLACSLQMGVGEFGPETEHSDVHAHTAVAPPASGAPPMLPTHLPPAVQSASSLHHQCHLIGQHTTVCYDGFTGPHWMPTH